MTSKISRIKSMVSQTIEQKIKHSDIGLRMWRGISWSFIGSLINKGLLLISFIFLARIIGKDDYGKVGIIRSTITMFMTFSVMGMASTTSRYISIYRNSDLNKASEIHFSSFVIALFFATTIGLLMFLNTEYISIKSFGTNILSTPLRISVIVLFFTSLSSVLSGSLSGFEDFKSIGVSMATQGVVQSILIVLGGYFWGVNGTIVGLGLSAVLLFLLFFQKIKKHFKTVKAIRLKFDKEFIHIVLNFSLPAVLASLLTLPIFWWSKTLLIKSADFGEMAIFDIAEQWAVMLMFIPSSIGGIILPLLSNTIAEGTENQYKKLLKINLYINGGVTLLLALVIIPSSKFILSLYGKGFTNNVPLIIMAVATILQAINGVLGQVIASKGRMWIGLLVNLLWAIWLVLFANLFIKELSLGATGLSLAMLCSYILHSIVQGVVSSKIK